MKKTIKKRALISAIAMLIVSAIVLTSSTFAWFSMSKEAQVSTLNLNITTADGISISANTHKFGTSITYDDIIPTPENAGKGLSADSPNTNCIPDLLAPASSDFRLVNGFPVFYNGSIGEDTSKVILTKYTDDYSGKIVVFDLFVQVSENNKTVKFTGSTLTCDESVTGAMRVGIVNCGFKEYANKEQAKTLTTSLASNTAMWVVDGNTSDSEYIQYDCGNRTVFKDETNPVAINYNVASRAGSVVASASAFSFVAQKGVNRIRVYLWVEGNDPDCTNDVAGNAIDFNLKLSID